MFLNCGAGEDLRVSWTARRSNQSILKEINPEYSLEELKLKLKLQYVGYLMRRTDSFEKTVMLGKIEGRRRRGWQRTRWMDGITNSQSLLKLRSIESVMPSSYLCWTFVGKVMSLLFNMLSRLVITFLPRSKCLLISWLQSPPAVILEPKKIKSVTISTLSPSFFHEVMGPDAMILVF